MIVYSALLVAVKSNPITTTNSANESEADKYVVDTVALINEFQQANQQQRRQIADKFDQDTESEDEDQDNTEPSERPRFSINSDSDAPTSTDSDSPYGSGSESSSSYDEYHAMRKIPKKKIHRHHTGPIQSYFQEKIAYWPKNHYKQRKLRHLKKRGIPITYQEVHTAAIKKSLKDEERERLKEKPPTINFVNMIGDLAKNMSFVSLDPNLSLKPVDPDTISIVSSLSNLADAENTNSKSQSTFGKMKKKLRSSFKRERRPSYLSVKDEQRGYHSDTASRICDTDARYKSNPSLNKL